MKTIFISMCMLAALSACTSNASKETATADDVWKEYRLAMGDIKEGEV